MKNILIFAASTNANMRLATEFAQTVEKQGHSPHIIDLAGLGLPLFTPEEAAKKVPQQLKALVEKVHSAEGMIFVAPEYNKGIPPVLTNFIAWISVESGDDWRACFNAKPALVGTHSGGGGLHVLMAMRMQLSEMGMNVLGRQIHTHFKKQLNKESMEEMVMQLIATS